LATNFVRGESFIDLDGHGTHCAGIIAGAVGGIAKGVQLLVAKVLDRNGRGSGDQVAAGVKWAIENKADIISMSLGMSVYHDKLHEAVQEAISKGIVVVCAAGNSGSRYRFNVSFPASIAGTIRVGSIGRYGASSCFSSVGGPQIDAAAIGEEVVSTHLCKGRKASYQSLNGTSMATPAVAAICAMLLAYDRALIRPKIPAGLSADDEKGYYRLKNAHCVKDILGKLCFNSSLEVGKGRGSPDLAHVLRVPAAFTDHLDHIC
jgi:major intracellular serine protease